MDCFGKERLEEYRGKHKLDVVLVYAVDPLVVQQAPGGRANAKVVSKATFGDFSLPHADGSYYLRPDRIVGAFLLDPARPPLGHEEVRESLLEERTNDEEARGVLERVEKRLEANNLHAGSSFGENGVLPTKVPRKAQGISLDEAPLQHPSSPDQEDAALAGTEEQWPLKRMGRAI